MIGKVTIGSSFGGVVRYVMGKEEASLILAEGVRMENVHSMTDDFNTQRKLNPDLKRAVGHVALSWSKEDAAQLSPQIMKARALEYMQKMKITDSQFILVEHRDKSHPHLHIIYNRVNNQGKTISDQFQKERNQKVCKEITMKYGYHLGKGKAEVKGHHLKGADKIKYELYDAIKSASREAQSWNGLKAKLESQGINIIFKYKAGTSEIQGISFAKSGLQFKGSKIDRSMSYGRLDALIRQNQKQVIIQQPRNIPVYRPTLSAERIQPIASQHVSQNDRLIDDLFKPAPLYDQPGAIPFKKKKRKKHLGQSL